MAFTERVIAVARETKLFVGLETTPGTLMPPTDSGMRLVLTHQAGQVQQNIRLIDDPQYRNTRSRLLPITASYDAGKYNLPCLLKTVAGAGTPATPEIDPFLRALMGIESETDAAWFGATPHRAYKLKGVDPGGTIYPSFSLWFKVGHTVFYAAGATCNQADFSIAGNELVSCAFQGEFMRHGWCGTDYAVGGGSGTSLVVGDARKFWLADTDAGDKVYIQIQAADGTLSSAVGVEAVNYGSNTLTLDGSATWQDGDLIVPYLPDGTELGSPLYGKYGLVLISAYAAKATQPVGTQLVNSARITLTNGIKYHADVKDNKNYPTEYVVPSFRDVKGEINLFQYRNIPTFNYKAQQDPLVPDYLRIPAQDKSATQGRIVHFHVPRAIWETPNQSGEDEKSSSIAFRGVATSDYNDEFAIVYMGG